MKKKKEQTKEENIQAGLPGFGIITTAKRGKARPSTSHITSHHSTTDRIGSVQAKKREAIVWEVFDDCFWDEEGGCWQGVSA